MIKKTAKTLFGLIESIIFLGCPICFFIVMRDLPPKTLIWFLLPLFSIVLICILDMILLLYELLGNYSERFLNRCCWCNYILLILIGLFVTTFFYSSYIALTMVNFFHFKNTNIYIYIFTFIACRATLINSTPYYIQTLKNDKKPKQPLIDANANRVVILLSYLVFLLVTQTKQTAKLDIYEIIMIGFMFYLAFDNLYASIISNLPQYKTIFEYTKHDHEIRVKKINISYNNRQKTL